MSKAIYIIHLKKMKKKVGRKVKAKGYIHLARIVVLQNNIQTYHKISGFTTKNNLYRRVDDIAARLSELYFCSVRRLEEVNSFC